MKYSKFIFPKTEPSKIQKILVIFYFVMTLIKLFTIDQSSFGSHMLWYSALLLAYAGLSEQIVYKCMLIALSIIVFVGSLLFSWIVLHKVFAKKNDAIFVIVIVVDFLISLILGFHNWWNPILAAAFIVLYVLLKWKQAHKKDLGFDQEN